MQRCRQHSAWQATIFTQPTDLNDINRRDLRLKVMTSLVVGQVSLAGSH